MADRPTIIAVDFDGCLCRNAWPEIGEAREDVIRALLERQKRGAKIILWTCRVGERLAAAVQWCADHGIAFDAVNANLPVNIAAFGNDCRKIYADEYWDDKAVNPEICDPSIPSERMDNPPMLHINPDCFLEMPINPEGIRLLRETWNPKDYPGQSRVVPTNHVSVRSEVFVILREMARMIVNGTEWNKKARIVLEYDPQCQKMEIKTFMERDEATPPTTDGAVFDVTESDIAESVKSPDADKKAEGILSPFFVMFNEDNTVSLKKPNSEDEIRLTNDTVRVLASILNDRIQSL